MRSSRIILAAATVWVLAATSVAQTTDRISVAGVDTQVNNGSDYPSCSADGRFVAFESNASNLVAGDTNGQIDVFVRDTINQTTTRVSVSSAGTQGNTGSLEPSISADGRYVAFTSYANTLVAGDTNAFRDIFVHDRQTGITTRVSVNSAGVQANGFSEYPKISGDGRFVVFQSSALNLDPPDYASSDIYIHDRLTGATRRMSVNSAGQQANGASLVPAINPDGRYVTFESYATNMEGGDTNGFQDIFVRDRQTGITSAVSLTTAGGFSNAASYRPSISADGRFVAFESTSTNLVPNDTNAVRDVFVRDRQAGTTIRVSVSSTGAQANGACYGPTISADGRYVAFHSIASTLIEGDVNGGMDIYVRDLVNGETSRVSVSTAGGQGNGASQHAAIDAQAQRIAFNSGASNLISGDTNNVADIFVHWLGTAPVSLLNVTLSPSSVPGGTASTGTVTLTNAAPTGGALVSFYSNNSAAASVPFYVTVAGGTLSKTFSITTQPVDATVGVVISAFTHSDSQSATLTVRAPAPLSVVPASSSVVGGNQITGTVTLDSAAGSSDVLVRMTDDSASILMSTYCIVNAGLTSGNFNIWTYGVATSTQGTISAYANGVTKTTILTLLPAAFDLFWINPTQVIGGNPSGGNARLNGKAPAGGVIVTLSSSNTAAASMAASTTIAYGSNLKNFPISSFGVDAVKNVTITGVALGVTKTATLQVRPAELSGITLASNPIQGGTSTIATVTMTGKAGPLGRTISLSSNNPLVTVPATMYIPPQKASWTFTVQSQTVSANTTVRITASQGLVSHFVDLVLTP